MLDIRKMALLRELSRLGTIAAVAEAQFCTPSAVSQQLAALEREAGVRLLRRSGRGVALTAAGADLAERAGGVLALLEEASAALASARTELAGELRIGAFPTAVRTLLPAALVALGAAHPRLELHVTELDPAQAPDALRADLLDIALVHEYDYVPAEADPALVTQPLLSEPVYLASAAGHAPAAPDPVSASRALPWIVGSPGTLCHLMVVRLCQAAGFTPRIRHYADDFAAVLTLVAAGQGVAVVPELALADCPDGVALAALSATRRTLIACRRGAQAHPAIAACTGAIRAAAAGYAVPLIHRAAPAASGARRPVPRLSTPSS
jgi:DNA-binding transcriptional LysR family regulator